MKLWIDAATLSSERVFGMTLIERHLKAARHQRLELSEVVIDTGGQPVTIVTVPEDSGLSCPIRVVSVSGEIAARIAAAGGGEVVLATTATSLIDARLYGFLAKQEHDIAVADDGAVLARLSPATHLEPEATELARALNNNIAWLAQADFPSFVRNLRRHTPFYLFSVTTPDHRRKIERFLFWSNYKGSTDFFTKYVYPPLVWMLVPPLARARVHPNVVTIISIILTFVAVPLFAGGYFFWGFVCAYTMSVLDSVDGKLARLTFTDSPIGNILDHGLDLVHPPFWYCAWAWGLSGGDWHAPVFTASLWMLGLYVLDRLILKIYPTIFGRGLHTHAKLDAVVRTFISRRNINLPLFTIGYPLGFGVETIYIIVAWQALTCLYHGLRTFWILKIEKARPEVAPAR
ncbi:MAG TPA: CDP-alcohol phosphatidyltransferase family protein [Terriglobales bacterium]|nr:CDP-alcohol phosphatidyltransferase family protein [Terriglobales bacterium]